MNTNMNKIFGIHKSALIEMLSILTILSLSSVFFGDSSRFVGIHPHPFWIVILLMIVQYGTIEAIAATFFATVFMYAGNIPPQLVEETSFSYQFRLCFTPFLWFSASFLLGELRMRIQTKLEEAEEERDQAFLQAEAITRNYEVLKTVKENLESRLAGQIRTVAATYETVKELETLNPVQILMRLDNVVLTALNPKKFSVFASGPNGLEATTSVGWEPEDDFSRRFDLDTTLYREIVNNQRMVCVINKEDEECLDGEGVMAAPLVDAYSGEVFGMLKIEEIDFFKLDIGNLETFKTLCNLIGSAFSNAKKYKEAMTNAIYVSKKGIFSYNLYELLKGYLVSLSQKSNSPMSNLSLRLQEPVRVEVEKQQLVTNALYDILSENLPEGTGTPIFHGKGEKIHFEILLPNIDVREAENLSLKLLSMINRRDELKNYKFNFQSSWVFNPAAKKDEVTCE